MRPLAVVLLFAAALLASCASAPAPKLEELPPCAWAFKPCPDRPSPSRNARHA